MPAKPKRIDIYLSEAEHELVTQRAGMKTPAYLRRIVCGVLPERRPRIS